MNDEEDLSRAAELLGFAASQDWTLEQTYRALDTASDEVAGFIADEWLPADMEFLQ